VYSLDDENEVLANVYRLRTARIVGAFLKDGMARYSEDSNVWFDMGLLSRFGKKRADELKKFNARSHADIFAEIFGVAGAERGFHGAPALAASYGRWLAHRCPAIGINPFAGGRWPAKELRLSELKDLIRTLLVRENLLPRQGSIILIGAG